MYITKLELVNTACFMLLELNNHTENWLYRIDDGITFKCILIFARERQSVVGSHKHHTWILSTNYKSA